MLDLGILSLVIYIYSFYTLWSDYYSFTLVQWMSWVHSNICQVTISYITLVNLGILMFACVYLSILGLDAVYHRNAILLLAVCASNTCGFVLE